MKQLILSIVACVGLSACLVVEDFGTQWDAATYDTCMMKAAEKLYELSFEETLNKEKDTSDYVRSVTWNSVEHGESSRFVAIKKSPDDSAGHIHRVSVEDGVMTVWQPDRTKRKAAMGSFDHPQITIEEEKITISKLNEETMEILHYASQKADYWIVQDKMLYNHAKKNDCPWEDRTFDEDDR